MKTRNIVIITALVVAVVVAATFLLVKPKGNDPQATVLTVNTSPLQLSIDIDGEQIGQITDGDTLTLQSDKPVQITAYRDGFETYDTTIAITPGTPNSAEIALRPITDEAKAIVKDDDSLKQEQQVTEEYLNTAEQAYKNYPILKAMPHEDRLFSIYQGLPQAVGYDFGIYLYLYKGHEEDGRQAFKKWMQEHGYEIGDYDVIEQIKEDSPANKLPELPSNDSLNDLRPENITLPTATAGKNETADQIAQLFATSSTTWDTAKDTHPTAGLLRTKPLMTKELAAGTEMPFKQTTTPAWRAATAGKAKSYSWIKNYESTSKEKTTNATIEVCWAWISEANAPVIEGPRTYTLGINSKNEISTYTYDDPDPFVDNTNTPCIPEN